MSKRQSDTFAGFSTRLEAALHLSAILKGKPFVPIGSDRLPDPRERALANKIVTAALRRHGHISHILAQTLKKGVPGRAGPLEAILRTAIAQLLFIDAVPAHSAINLAVEVARRDKRSGRFDKLVNGVLRQVQRDTERFANLDPLVLLPDWLKTRWSDAYGADAVLHFAQTLLESPPLDLTLKKHDPALIDQLGATPTIGNSVRLAERDKSVGDLPGYRQGQWWVQDVAATLAARLVDVKAMPDVLDLCAAPGGKTAQLAAAGANVTALDNDPARMERLAGNLDRLGLAAHMIVADALEWRAQVPFDAVLVDAPCSATGTFRRHPELIWQRTADGIAERVALQRNMIAHAFDLVRPGGVLIYCVCSLEREEGEDQLAWALETLKGVGLSPVDPSELGGWADPITAQGAIRTHPVMDLPDARAGGLDGFFIARLTKS